MKLNYEIFETSSILLGKSNDNEVLKSDLDSLNILTKKSPERAIRFARELLKKVAPISESSSKYWLQLKCYSYKER